jgi:CubicO group peptidase (beta-lactamase class C family)
LAVVVVVAAVVVTAVVSVRWPWAIPSLLEGRPSRTWPADGHYAHHDTEGRGLETAVVPEVASEPFLTAFDQSQGSAIVVVEDGVVVYEHYAQGHGPETLFNSYSMVKSLVGVLVLASISGGQIAGLEQTVGELWPDAAQTEIAPVTVRELLDMRSGISFEREPGDLGGVEESKRDQIHDYGPLSPLARLHIEGVDQVIGDARLVESDRGGYSYQNLNTAILGRILEEVHGRPLDELLQDQIAGPAGAGAFRWRLYLDDGRVSPYCCLYATARWWASVAQFVLDNGADEPLLSEELHAYLLGRDLPAEDLADGEYRNQIRHDVLDRDGEELQGPFLYFTGLGGQMTYLVPDEDLIVVRFGQRYQPLFSTLYQVSQFEPPGP